MGRSLEGGPDDEDEKAEEKAPPSALTSIIRGAEISEEELEQEMHAQRVWERKNTHRKKRGGSR